jgi:RNA binding exosome subunit
MRIDNVLEVDYNGHFGNKIIVELEVNAYLPETLETVYTAIEDYVEQML